MTERTNVISNVVKLFSLVSHALKELCDGFRRSIIHQASILQQRHFVERGENACTRLMDRADNRATALC